VSLHDIEIPLKDGGIDKNHKLIVDEFAGDICLTVKDIKKDIEIDIRCSFGDLERAWQAVKRY
jgi:hypothetical protein